MIKKWQHWFITQDSRIEIKPKILWHWKFLGVILVVVIGLLTGFEIYDAGRRNAGFDRSEVGQVLTQLKNNEAVLRQENVVLKGLVDANESKLQIERSAQQQFSRQVKLLEVENARLKEDLAFFENLLPTEKTQNTFSINRFRVEAGIVPGQFHYRLLLLQTGKQEREFRGALQFVVSLQHSGKAVTMTFPREGSNEPGYKISFKRLHRAEGIFNVPPGASIKTVQVRLLENGITKAMQTFNVS